MDDLKNKVIKPVEDFLGTFDGEKVLETLKNFKGKSVAPFYLVLFGTVIFFVAMLALSYYIDGASGKAESSEASKKPKRKQTVVKKKNDPAKKEKVGSPKKAVSPKKEASPKKEGTPKKSSRTTSKSNKLGSLETPDGRRVSLRNKERKKL